MNGATSTMFAMTYLQPKAHLLVKWVARQRDKGIAPNADEIETKARRTWGWLSDNEINFIVEQVD